jgi:glutamate---methylamine ligase
MWDKAGTVNVFADPKMELGLSAKGKNFLGGIMKHASALAAITNPTVNSYKRINAPRTVSGATWAPNSVTWTGNNRPHMVSVPGPGRSRGSIGQTTSLRSVSACRASSIV